MFKIEKSNSEYFEPRVPPADKSIGTGGHQLAAGLTCRPHLIYFIFLLAQNNLHIRQSLSGKREEGYCIINELYQLARLTLKQNLVVVHADSDFTC